MVENHCCVTCVYHKEDLKNSLINKMCVNEYSEHFTEQTNYGFVCSKWKGLNGKG